MKKFFCRLLDAIFPRQCVGCGDLENVVCDVCLGKVEGEKSFWVGERIFICFPYHCLLVRKLIGAVKYKFFRDVVGIVGEMMVRRVLGCGSFGGDVFGRGVMVIPVPPNRDNYLNRGFNQALELGKILGGGCGWGVYDCLDRSKRSPPQARMKRSERLRNIFGEINMKKGFDMGLGRKTIVIVDDVYTTGATFRECSRVLVKAGADKYKIYGVFLAGRSC